ncbi:MAG: PEP-CTERM-box response regulator transcription factor [Dissulfurispiraceae bacterium]|jgi:two-component system NtrC family response regulator|nr:PEP-CTERM-box response regulator transcription factor [Dissulfurispiraceae bacterium]
MEDLFIVDDNEDIRTQLKWGLGNEYAVRMASDAEEAIKAFTDSPAGIVLLDLGLPPDPDGVNEGFRCLERMTALSPASKIIVVTGRNEREHALRAIQSGAYDFYQKPIDLKELKIIISRAAHLNRLEAENRQLMIAASERRDGMSGMIGSCSAMQGVFETIRKIASSDVPVLIIGESGTGKELVAKAIHENSSRHQKSFVAINCGAIPENLLEAELFGYEKGAYTGAAAQTQGKVEYAHEGTLFLDEIAELTMPLQVKLLRFLQEKTIQRVGGRKDIEVNARIVAATNADIKKSIAENRFREDLYYRLGVITVSLPPLRERGDDVMMLANFFLNKFSQDANKKIKGFGADAVNCIKNYDWPGNVRELENKVQRAVLLSDSKQVSFDDLGLSTNSSSPDMPGCSLTLKEAKERLERQMLLAAQKRHGGNMTRISDELGVSRTTLYDIIKRHGLLEQKPD